MKRFEQMTFAQIKNEILRWEQDDEATKDVDVIFVGQNPDVRTYKQGDDTTCEHFLAMIVIDGVKQLMGYEWDCDDEEISASWIEPGVDF